MKEAKLISTILTTRTAYEKLEEHIQQDTFTDMGRHVYSEVRRFYETDADAKSGDVDIISERLTRRFPKRSADFVQYLEALPEPTSLDNLVQLFAEVRQEQLGLEIISALTRNQTDAAARTMQEYIEADTLGADSEPDPVTVPGLDGEPPTERIPLYPTRLNDALRGGVPRGSQVCLFARTNVGKSTFAVNLVGAAAGAGYRVLYLGNEDEDDAMRYRFASRLTGASREAIEGDPETHDRLASEAGLRRITFVRINPGTLPEIRRLANQLRPDIIVLDQTYRMATGGRESATIYLAQIFAELRTLAQELKCVVITVAQAGERAKGRLVLEQEDIEWSNTGVPAQTDLMIGLGQNKDFERRDRVMISVPRWKYGKAPEPFHAQLDYEKQKVLA